MKKYILLTFLICLVAQQGAFARPRLVKTTITSTPSGAKVYINGGNYVNEAYTTPVTQNLHQGIEYSLTFVLNGYETKTISYVGGTGTVRVTLNRPGTTTNDPTITEVDEEDDSERWVKARITSNPDSRVKVDGGNYSNERYSTPVDLNFYDGERYTLTFSKSGYVSQQVTFYGGQRELHVTLEPEIVYHTITFDSNIRGAQVYIDDDYIGETRCTAQLEEGSYTLTVKKSGYNTYTKSFSVSSDDTKYIELEEVKYLRLTLPTGAKVWVDGRAMRLNFRGNSNRTFKINANGRDRVKIKIQYHGLVAEEYHTFDKQTLKVELLLTE